MTLLEEIRENWKLDAKTENTERYFFHVKELERIVARCLRKDPARRFQNMSDLHVALTELKEESDSGSLSSAGPVAKSRKHVWLWTSSAAIVCAAPWINPRLPPM